jgi:hypothetical protein
LLNAYQIKPVAAMPRIGNKQIVHALHGPNFSLDMAMLGTVHDCVIDRC